MSHEVILNAYKQQQQRYEDFGNVLIALLVELLQKSGLHIHTITARLKDPSSLGAKLCPDSAKLDTVLTEKASSK